MFLIIYVILVLNVAKKKKGLERPMLSEKQNLKFNFRVFIYMKKLYNESDFNNATVNIKFPCKCYQCENIFYKQKRQILKVINNVDGHTGKYCSRKCLGLSRKINKNHECSNCNEELNKKPWEIKKSKSGNHFCSKSCAASYNNKNKKHGARRSKLEMWLEEQLNNIYPDLDIEFNGKEAIGSELDIYIESLNLAFELNGIFHYEPIYGENKLEKIQENDGNKFQKCQEHNISLCVIDTSGQKYFKPKSSKKYLDIITKIISNEYC